jgi:hypothetical protein
MIGVQEIAQNRLKCINFGHKFGQKLVKLPRNNVLKW